MRRTQSLAAARRAVGIAFVVLALLAIAPPPAGEPERRDIPFAARYAADLHGSFIRAGNSVVTCDEALDEHRVPEAAPCADARRGVGEGILNNNYQMKYVNTDPAATGPHGVPIRSASEAALRFPPGAKRIAYARLYWGAMRGMDTPDGPEILGLDQIRTLNLRVPGEGFYRTVTADSDIGYMRGEVEYGYQATADVTPLVRAAGAGSYTVANLSAMAMPYAWGAWTLVVAYESDREPLRRLQLWDGYRTVDADAPPVALSLGGLGVPKQGPVRARLGYITYDGDRTLGGDHAEVQSTTGARTPLSGTTDPPEDVMNSTAGGMSRTPADANTFGYDADEFDIHGALLPGDTGLTLTFGTLEDGFQVGAVYTSVDLPVNGG
jgi:hypothetical protein